MEFGSSHATHIHITVRLADPNPSKDYPDGIIHIYVDNCEWKNDFDFCLKRFTLVVFHEVMHVLLGPDVDEHVPYAERVLAEIFGEDK
jgi:hypothetical protein